MTGNEVTPNYYDKAVFLRVSGFVQQEHPADCQKRRFFDPVSSTVNGSYGQLLGADH
jgi:hypothetical protein